ncbi:MAG: NAD-dependent epimerase/dehydratase family protein [Bdellovibrionaceae bacterium]|nr:NAD-dependent epimerase/dehydratase family protein [Pseudobdellovibrionaceae bacterium]
MRIATNMEMVILGSTGLVGTAVVKELLLEEKCTKIVSIGRRSLSINNPKILDVQVANIKEIENLTLQVSEPVFICCFGTTLKNAGNKENFFDLEYNAILNFAKLALKYNAKKFVLVSSMGANAKSVFFYNKVKGKIENDLKQMGLKSLVIFRPGLLVGNRIEARPLEKISIEFVQKLDSFIGQKVLKSFATKASGLAGKIMQESLSQDSVYKIVESSKI